MAMIDSERDVVLVRIVYDGPPSAGKTATLYALEENLRTAGKVYTPTPQAAHSEYFEWLEYTGGVFNGRPITCQIVTTPGLPEHAARRRYLLQSADAVVFVLDARPEQVAVGLEYFRELETILADLEPPARTIVQANRQDMETALQEDRLAWFFPEEQRIQAASASLNKGVRETFVFAVGLAVERARKAMQQGKLMLGAPRIADGEALYAEMQAQAEESSAGDALLAKLLAPLEGPREEPTAAPEAAEADGALADAAEEITHARLPGAATPQSWLWPPLTARQGVAALGGDDILREIAEDGAWILYHPSGTRALSRPAWLYADEAAALAALRRHARRHLHLSLALPEARYLALAATPDQHYRLWQIVAAQEDFRQRLDALLQVAGDVAGLGAGLWPWLQEVYRAAQALGAHLPLAALRLDNLGVADDLPVYLGLLDADAGPGVAPPQEELSAWLRGQLAEALPNALLEKGIDGGTLLELLEDRMESAPELGEVLLEVCLSETAL